MAKQGGTEVKSDKELLNHEEMNLVEYPIGLISDRPPIDRQTKIEVKTFSWERWISLPDGTRVLQQWKVTGSDEYGLPRGFDFCVLFLLIQLWSEQGFVGKRVEAGSIYRLLTRLGLPDEGHSYKRVRDALDRLLGASYYTRYAIWDYKKKTYLPRLNFNLLSHISYDTEEILEDLGVCVPAGTVHFSDALVFLVRRGYFKPTDVERYWRLKTPYARRLFQFLDKRRINGKVQRFDIYHLAKKLGTPDETLRRYKPSDIRRNFEPHLAVLSEVERYLEKYGWVRAGKRTYLEVCYAGVATKRPTLSEREQSLLDEIVDTFDEEGSRRYYERAIAEAGREKVRQTFEEVRAAWDAQRVKNPGALMVTLLEPERKAKATSIERAKIIAACSLCNEQGIIQCQGRKGELTVMLCPHDIEAVRALETIKGLTRM
jgi:plasmid replication initiation protein